MSYTSGPHHQHARKKVDNNLEPLPSQEQVKSFVDKIIYAVGILGPVMTLPQLWIVWINHNTAGISTISWGAYAFFSAVWIIYGILHKEKPIIITYTLWCLMETLIVIGTIIY